MNAVNTFNKLVKFQNSGTLTTHSPTGQKSQFKGYT